MKLNLRSLIKPLLLCLLLQANLTAAEIYEIDTENSIFGFEINNINDGVEARVPGKFTKFSGTISFDPETPSASWVEIEVDASSIDTAIPKRDQHLRSPDFFNVKEFPTLHFKSKRVKKSGAQTYRIAGHLTLMGITKKVVAECKVTGDAQGEVTFHLKRSDYGMTFGLPNTADDVAVKLQVVGIKKSP